ncbi:MAG TPA: YciI family protein [Dokdonella sp.]|nr:YciI family protein [Dokdonella sp.]
MRNFILGVLLALSTFDPVNAADAPKTNEAVADPALAKRLGADERGMRHYVLAILKTGPHRMPDGKARDEMFAGHFANITRLADAGKLAVAGPFGDKNDWRGMFVFAVETPEEAAELAATDPVIRNGEMIAEYHRLYASAALMSVYETHLKIAPK